MQVTIGLPFYNAESDLPNAIRSVFAQTHQDWELILIDDGSTDRSVDIANSIKDARVRVISDGRNLRLAARLNQIVDSARYDVIARMDADDLMPPDRLEKQLAVLEREPAVDLVSSGLVSLDSNWEPTGARWHSCETITRDQLLRKSGAGIVHAAVIGRRAWFQRNRYDANVPIAQDYDLWLRASAKGDLNIRIIQQPLYYVRELGSVTSSKMFRSYRMDRKAIWRHKNSLWDARFVIKSYVKTTALLILVVSGNLEWLVRRRSQAIDDVELVNKVRSDTDMVLKTQVPGL